MKMAILPKAFYMFNEIPMKISITFFMKTENSILKVSMEAYILSKKNNAGGITIQSSNYSTDHKNKKAQHGTGKQINKQQQKKQTQRTMEQNTRLTY
jgi:hypothetical protein